MSEDVYLRPKEASKILKVSQQTLREWADSGKIKTITTRGGHRRYKINSSNDDKPKHSRYIYARVSSSKQKEDLQRQVLYLKKKFPEYQVITDIGSGINFNRQGFKTLLDKVLTGDVQEIVVAHKDRLTRFGFDFIDHICSKFGTEITILDETNNAQEEPQEEFTKDIITHFTAKYYGSRKYEVREKD